jgi:hypothetical protein
LLDPQAIFYPHLKSIAKKKAQKYLEFPQARNKLIPYTQKNVMEVS